MEITRVRPLMMDKRNAVYRALYPARKRGEALTHAGAGLRPETQGRGHLVQDCIYAKCPEQVARGDRSRLVSARERGREKRGDCLMGSLQLPPSPLGVDRDGLNPDSDPASLCDLFESHFLAVHETGVTVPMSGCNDRI